jgi:hypothetical protein
MGAHTRQRFDLDSFPTFLLIHYENYEEYQELKTHLHSRLS